mgnify:CR=1 FL=1
MMEAVLSYQGEQGLKGFLKSCSDLILDVEVADEGSFVDADTKRNTAVCYSWRAAEDRDILMGKP